jgi:hypothetical protein
MDMAWLLAALIAQSEVTIEMRVGIVGGIVAPTVKLELEIALEKDKDEATVRFMRLKDNKPVVKKGTMTRKEVEALLKDIEKVWDLPKEDPEGCEDIYGLDTGLHVQIDRQSWRNGGPGGCVHGQSKVQATEEQKKTFKKIVDKVSQIAEKHASQE